MIEQLLPRILVGFAKRAGQKPFAGLQPYLFLVFGFLGVSMCAHVALAQSSLPPIWYQFFTQHRAKNGLFLEADASFRGDQWGAKPTMALARVGLGHHWQAGYVAAGVAWFENIDTEPGQAERGELRVYQKLLLKQPFKQVELNHIYRIEERWLQRADHSAFDFHMQLRYMLQVMHSFESKTILKAQPYLTANNEIFLAPEKRVFNQYRIYGGAGLQWNKKWKLEFGYLHLWLPKQPDGTTNGAVLRTSVTYNW